MYVKHIGRSSCHRLLIADPERKTLDSKCEIVMLELRIFMLIIGSKKQNEFKKNIFIQ